MPPVTPASQAIQQVVGGQVNAPQAAPGTTVNPVMQNVGVDEDMTTAGVTGPGQTIVSQDSQMTNQAGTTAGTAEQVGAVTPSTAAQTTADTTGAAAQVTPAQHTTPLTQEAVGEIGTITDPASVRGQLADITTDIENALAAGSPLPSFARGAQRMAMAAMAQRGLSASTIAADAVAEGVLRASTQIAAADAGTYKQMLFQNLSNRQQAMITNAQNYFQMDVANLNNNQQAALANAQLRQQKLLSDQSATNAARQFNAKSQNQVDQFFAQVNKDIGINNAARTDAMGQFNESEQNKINATNAKNSIAVSEANAQRKAAVDEFNSTIADSRDKFNVENQRVIDQSNVEWRRSINTANTAATNAANETNAQNLLDISNWAMNSMWNQWRDEATWAIEASENQKNRAHNMAVAAMERATTFDIMDEEQKNKLLEVIGAFGAALWASGS